MKKISAAIAVFTVFSLWSVHPDTIIFPPQEQIWYFDKETDGEVIYNAGGQFKNPDAAAFKFVPELDLSLKEYFEKTAEGIRPVILIESDNTLVYEWKDPKTDMFGMTQLRKVPSGIQIFEIKTEDIAKANQVRDGWRDILNKYTFEMVPEKISFNIKWAKGRNEWEQKEIEEETYYFYPKGQDKSDWKERLTVNIWNYIDVDPKEYFERIKKALVEKQGPHITVEPISIGKDHLLFEWSDGKYKELYKLRHVRPNVTTLIRYGTKDPQADLREWKKNLESSEVTVEYRTVVTPRPR